MNIISFLAFQDELEKLGFNVMESAAKEGIELAKKLKAKNVVPKAGNALKDYMHHMDLSAHPRFAQKMKTTVQGGGMPKAASALTDADFEKLAKMKLSGVPKGLKRLAESALDTAGSLSRAQEYAHLRHSAHLVGKEGRIGARAGQQLKSEALSVRKPLEKTDLTSVNRKVNLRGNGFSVGQLDSDRNYSKYHKNKKASAFAHGAELAGLGVLAAPSVAHLRGKEWSEKNKARAEVGGLGILAAPSLAAAGKAGFGKLKSLASKMPKHASDSSKASMTDEAMNRFSDAHKSRQRDIAETLKAIDSGAEARRLRLHPPVKKSAKIPKNKLMAGVVASGVAAIGAKKAYDHFKKKKTAAPAMSAMLNMHRLADSAKAAKSVAKPMTQLAKKLPSQAEHASRAAALSSHTAVGGHAWNPGAQARRALSL